ncbi:MAG: PDC sensor domain-containing protein, partial [Phycisphaerales bacterium]|nr:PDC sensor domain-containing protein [Phycisphaerales bacterium]
MTEAKPRPHHRLLGKLLLLVLLPVLAVVLVILGINASRTWNRLGDSLKQELRDATKLAVALVEADNRKAVAVAETMAIAQVSGLFAQRERTLAMCRAVLEANPELQGAYVAYEPNGDVIDAVGLEGTIPREAMSEDGRFIPYYRRDAAAPGGMRLEPLTGMEDPTSLWYFAVKADYLRTKKARPMVTRPYDYEGVFLIEQTYPIVIGGHFKGVAGVDRALAQLQRDLVAIREVTGVDLLLETRGLFVAATVDADRVPGAPALQATAVKDSPFADLFSGRTATDRFQMFEAVDPQLDDTCFYATATVPTGGWTLVARKP